MGYAALGPRAWSFQRKTRASRHCHNIPFSRLKTGDVVPGGCDTEAAIFDQPMQPMAFGSDATSVLSLAQNVADEFSRAPAVFSPGQRAAIDLISELRSYQQFHSARNTNHPNSQANFESSLTANLRPCRDALATMLDIRRKYGRSAKLGVTDSIRWRLDEKQFEQQAASLRQDTARLRELVQELRRSAVVSSANQQQPIRDRGVETPSFETKTIVSISGMQYSPYPHQHTPTPPAPGISSAPRNQKPAPSEMCPNGPGCRTPRCHLIYLHPHALTCVDGKNCGLRNCEKWHPKSALCPKGPSCPMVGCDKAHPWPREQPIFPLSHTSNESSFSSLSSYVTDASSTSGSQSSQQPSEWDSRSAAPPRQTAWRGPGTRTTAWPAQQPGGSIVVQGRLACFPLTLKPMFIVLLLTWESSIHCRKQQQHRQPGLVQVEIPMSWRIQWSLPIQTSQKSCLSGS